VPLWMHLSLHEECRARAERGLAALRSGSFDDPRAEMKLRAALGACLILTRGGGREIAPALTRALELAQLLDDTEYQLRALCGLAFCHTYSGQHRLSLELAQQFRRLAAKRPDPNDELVGERLIGIAQHLLGDQPSTRRHTQRVLDRYIESDRRSYVIRFNFDLLVGARGYLARALWLLGFPEQAMRAVERTVSDARAANHAMTVSYALALAACPIALLVGDLAAAERFIEMLLEHSRRHALTFWHALGCCHQGLLAIRRGDVDRGSELLRTTLDDIGEGESFLRLSTFADVRTEASARAGRVPDALAAIEAAIYRTERNDARWLLADYLRRKGELLLLQGGEDSAASAEEQFQQALSVAREQRALSWELRAAASLARLLRDQGRSAEALALLQPVYERFTEGFDTSDLKAARNLLDTLPAGQRASRANLP
jgi:predicted ATPase